MAVGELYNGPQVLATQTENLLVKHFQAFSIYLFQHARLVLDIALRAEINWLFEDVVCHLAGDPKRDDQDIQDELDPKMAALVLKKRKSLRRMMRDIDRELLLFKTFPNERFGATLASACFRPFLASWLTYEREEDWLNYAKKHRRLIGDCGKTDLSHACRHFVPNHCDLRRSTVSIRKR